MNTTKNSPITLDDVQMAAYIRVYGAPPKGARRMARERRTMWERIMCAITPR